MNMDIVLAEEIRLGGAGPLFAFFTVLAGIVKPTVRVRPPGEKRFAPSRFQRAAHRVEGLRGER